MLSDNNFARFALTAASIAVGLSFGLAVAVVRAEAPSPRAGAPSPHSAAAPARLGALPAAAAPLGP
jgi:hypothetical protein